MLCCIVITDTVIPRLAHCHSEQSEESGAGHLLCHSEQSEESGAGLFPVILSKAKNLMSETLRREPVWCARSFTPPDGFVQEDKRTAASMVTRERLRLW